MDNNTEQRCKNCKHFEPLTKEDSFGHFLNNENYLNYGGCNGIVTEGKHHIESEDIMLDEAYGDLAGMYFHKEFGCIKFLNKQEA